MCVVPAPVMKANVSWAGPVERPTTYIAPSITLAVLSSPVQQHNMHIGKTKHTV
jgi:hypothetical protein